MIVAVDVCYGSSDARAAAVGFAAWIDPTPALERTLVIGGAGGDGTRAASGAPVGVPAPYRSGAFFERELPAVQAILSVLGVAFTCVVVDAYAWLPGERPGLGAHLWHALERAVPVVGVAKNPLRDHRSALPVLRGRSERPLWVTAAGMEPAEAAHAITSMHGPHRIPTLLARVDRLARHEDPTSSAP